MRTAGISASEGIRKAVLHTVEGQVLVAVGHVAPVVTYCRQIVRFDFAVKAASPSVSAFPIY